LKRVFFISATLLFASCVKDKPQVTPAAPASPGGGRSVYVINEGNFSVGNSSISRFDPASGEVVPDIYKHANGSGPGDVSQSLSVVNGSFVLVVNGSGKVLVCDGDFRRQREIALPSPRYLLPVTAAKCYVSDLKSGAIAVVNLTTGMKTGEIKCPGWTEQMLMVYHKVYVTNMSRSYLYVVNTIEERITDSISVGFNAGSLVLDRNDKIWVLSGGDETKGAVAKLTRIDPLTDLVEQNFDILEQGFPRSLSISPSADTLYFLNGPVYRLSINDTQIPAQPFIAKGTRNYYGIGISHRDGRIYLSDALDYIQATNVYYFSRGGAELGSFKAGINASGFLFE
jgi:DNA-binding beta-propeller fold protein YncE